MQHEGVASGLAAGRPLSMAEARAALLREQAALLAMNSAMAACPIRRELLAVQSSLASLRARQIAGLPGSSTAPALGANDASA